MTGTGNTITELWQVEHREDGEICVTPGSKSADLDEDRYRFKIALEHAAAMNRRILSRANLGDRSAGALEAYLSTLVRLGREGLNGDREQLEAAQVGLEAMKARLLLEEGSVIRRSQLRKLLQFTAITALLIATLGAGGAWFVGAHIYSDTSELRNYFLMLSAAVAAIWLSVATRRQSLTYEDLAEPDSLSKTHRIAYVIGFTLVLALIVQLRVFEFDLGLFKSVHVGCRAKDSLLFGALCGLSEQLLASRVALHANRMFGIARK